MRALRHRSTAPVSVSHFQPFCRPTSRRSRARALRAFTLLELLAVLVVIGILVGITLGITAGVQERSRVARAKSELATLAVALEQYRTQYGDYPWTPTGTGALAPERVLFNALTGYLGPKAGTDDVFTTSKRSFVELTRFTTESEDDGDLPGPSASVPLDNRLLDPWDQPYGYLYRPTHATGGSATWATPAFLLYSGGPDGAIDLGSMAPDSGLVADIPQSTAVNQDNLYAGRDG
ncbi:type II secretion system protein GspG [Congregicoccus parvus]|uniref:type II secretion system protein GspG n=1 Tax=Congregicoccus parvus TaxID=3081749 RepID=UPI003FA598B3